MARAAAKRVAHQNAAAVRRLLVGSFGTGILHVLLKVLWPGSQGVRTKDWLLFGLTAVLEQATGLVLFRMANAGDDLAQAGLTQVMWDAIYLIWFVHVASALISTKFWLLLLVLPCYATFLAYRKVLVPFIFRGQDPLATLFGTLTGRNRSAAAPSAAQEPSEEQLSKRQQKLKKRAEKGDPRIQMQQRQRF